MSSVAEAAPAPLRRNRDFWLLWTGVGVATVGNSVTTVAYPLLLIWAGRSAASAGLVASVGLLPLLLLQLPAGVFVDRWDRRRTMICCNLVCAAACASVWIAVLSGRLWVPQLMAVSFVEGTAFIFYRLSERAAVRNVVHPTHLPAALAQNQVRGRATGLLGSPVGSSLFALVRWAPFLFATLGHAVAVVNLLLVKKKFQMERMAAPRRLRAELVEGIAWMFRQRFLRTAVLLVSVTNIIFNGLRLAIVVIINDHGGSPALVGVIGLMSGVGGIGGVLCGSYVIRRLQPGTVIICVFAVWSLAMPLVAFTSNPVLLGLLYAVMVFAGALINMVGAVYQVQITPNELQGRVGSVSSLLSSGTNSLGPLVAGLLLSRFSGGQTVLWFSAVMVGVTLLAAVSAPIRAARLEHLVPQEAGSAPAVADRRRPDSGRAPDPS